MKLCCWGCMQFWKPVMDHQLSCAVVWLEVSNINLIKHSWTSFSTTETTLWFPPLFFFRLLENLPQSKCLWFWVKISRLPTQSHHATYDGSKQVSRKAAVTHIFQSFLWAKCSAEKADSLLTKQNIRTSSHIPEAPYHTSKCQKNKFLSWQQTNKKHVNSSNFQQVRFVSVKAERPLPSVTWDNVSPVGRGGGSDLWRVGGPARRQGRHVHDSTRPSRLRRARPKNYDIDKKNKCACSK